MEAYLDPIRIALISFPILAFFITIPFAVYNYKKYGYINKWRSIILFSLIFYLLTAYYLVVLPLPETRDIKSIQRPDTVHYNLKPFQSIRDIVRETEVDLTKPKTYSKLLRERAFLQVMFNVLLLLPLGVYLRYYFKKSLKETIIISFLLSLFFEITQLTGLYGIYNAPYRLFDIDDLFLNTLGGMIGFKISPVIEAILPNTEGAVEDRKIDIKKVGYMRRLIAFFIDIKLVQLFSRVFYRDGNVSMLIFIIYFTLIPKLSDGRTLGLFLTNLRIESSNENKVRGYFLRSFSFYVLIYGVNRVIYLVNELNRQGNYSDYLVFLFLFGIVINIILIIHFISSIIKKKEFFYEKVSKTKLDIIY